jgi:branched-chain amino acid transport system substrate-binding protein
VLICFIATIGLMGCSKKAEEKAQASVIKVGWIAPFSGNYAWAGEYLLNGAKLAAEEINAKGGVNGVKIDIVYEDDGGDPTKSVNATIKLIEKDKVNIIMGPFNSSCTLANMKETERRQMPQITFSLSPVITKQNNQWIFRMSPSDEVTMTSILEYAVKVQGKKNIAFLTDTTDYGTGGYIVGAPYLEKNGLKPLTNEKFNIPDKDFTAQLLNIKKANPDALLLHGDEADCGLIAKQRIQLGMKDLEIIGGLPLTGTKYLETGGAEAVEGTIVATSFLASNPSPKVQDFVKNFTQKYGYAPEARCAAAYDGMYILAEALKHSQGKIDNISLRDAIRKVQNMEGVQGVFNFDEVGEGLHTVLKGIYRSGKIEFLAK